MNAFKGATPANKWRIKLHQARRRACIARNWLTHAPINPGAKVLTVCELDNRARRAEFYRRWSAFTLLNQNPEPNYVMRAES